MLTADLVHIRRRGDRLQVVPLGDVPRPRALELAAAYLQLAGGHLGLSRGALLEACRAVAVTAREQRLARGLLKLVLDRCLFEEGAALDPPTLRRELFSAAALRRAGGAGAQGEVVVRDGFDRQALLAEAAARHGVAVEDVERALYADLPDAHLLREFQALSPEALVDGYDAAQVQAVLLRAVKVTATVRAAPATFRQLFRRLKFLRLLHRIEPLPERKDRRPGGYQVEIDGPFALFDSVTRYGLALAMAYPALAACDEWAISADLRWGRDARPLRFEMQGRTADPPAGEDPGSEAGLPDEVAALLAELRDRGGPWKARVSGAVLDLPGVGLCVPDLELTHAPSKRSVYLEVLGFWSREAVWKRVELVRRGLPQGIVFAVSKHLRVSEEALDADLPAALYVYSRVMSARAILERAEKVAARGAQL